MLAAIITVAFANIITIVILDAFLTANLFSSSDVFLQKYVSAQPCGGLLQTGQGKVQFDQGGLEGGGNGPGTRGGKMGLTEQWPLA